MRLSHMQIPEGLLGLTYFGSPGDTSFWPRSSEFFEHPSFVIFVHLISPTDACSTSRFWSSVFACSMGQTAVLSMQYKIPIRSGRRNPC